MKDAENVDVAVWFYEVGYAVMLVKKNPDLARLFEVIPMSKAWMVSE